MSELGNAKAQGCTLEGVRDDSQDADFKAFLETIRVNDTTDDIDKDPDAAYRNLALTAQEDDDDEDDGYVCSEAYAKYLITLEKAIESGEPLFTHFVDV